MDLKITSTDHHDDSGLAQDAVKKGLDGLPSELIELILEHLPILDLLLSQRVCRTWRCLISRNPAMQEALFFRPAPGPFEGWKVSYTAADPIPFDMRVKTTFEPVRSLEGISQGLARLQTDGPSLQSRVDRFGRDAVAWFLVEGDTYTGDAGLEGVLGRLRESTPVEYAEKTYVRGKLNPLLWQQYDKEDIEEEYWEEDQCPPGFISNASKFCLRGRGLGTMAGFRHKLLTSDPTASWRRMYLSQPPPRRIWRAERGIRLTSDGWADMCYKTTKESHAESLGPETPVTMGAFLTAMLNRAHECSIFGLEGILCPHPIHELNLNQKYPIGDTRRQELLELLAAMRARRAIEADS